MSDSQNAIDEITRKYDPSGTSQMKDSPYSLNITDENDAKKYAEAQGNLSALKGLQSLAGGNREQAFDEFNRSMSQNPQASKGSGLDGFLDRYSGQFGLDKKGFGASLGADSPDQLATSKDYLSSRQRVDNEIAQTPKKSLTYNPNSIYRTADGKGA
jgi:hypothetical protein